MKKLVLLLSMAVLTAGAVQAQRFAYVDTDYILEQIPEYQAAQDELDKIAEEWRDEIDQRYKEIDDLYRKFQNEQVLLSDEMKQKRITEIEEKEKAVKEFQQQKFGVSGELFKKKQELVKPIQDDVYNEIQELAEKSSYDFIFDKSAGVSMLFANPRYDKSDDILKAMGIQPESESSDNK